MQLESIKSEKFQKLSNSEIEKIIGGEPCEATKWWRFNQVDIITNPGGDTRVEHSNWWGIGGPDYGTLDDDC